MKADLDRLMAARELDAVLVISDGHTYSFVADYLNNGAHNVGGITLKRRSDTPVMVVNPMEVEEAKRSGLEVLTWHDFGWAELLKEMQDNREAVQVVLWGRYLERFGVTGGKVGVYGVGEIHTYLDVVQRVRDGLPQYEFVGESGVTLFDEAAVTKDEDELARVRSVAQRTHHALEATWDFIASHRAEGDLVVNDDGTPLTIGNVKRFVRRVLLDNDLEDTGMIFAQGRDAGFPHSRGDDAAALRVGEAIVFDLFPREFGGGFHHDMTRTWCIGHAPDDVREVYDTVMTALEIAEDVYRPGMKTHLLQEAVLDYFEAQGHPTSRSQPDTTEGYVHSLGHGIGLKIHERPRISHLSKKDTFEAGNVITIEPGLYYPERGFGVRVEDAYIVNLDGTLESITPFRKDLVLPLSG